MCRPDNICLDTLRLEEIICFDTLRPEDTRCIWMANALTLLVPKADAVACVVRTTFALTLCVWKKSYALTLCVRKTRAASGWQMR